MNNDRHFVIAKEGWWHIAIALLLAIVATITIGWWSIGLWLFLLFVLQFFRDPNKDIPIDQEGFLSPADGRVVLVEKCADPEDGHDAIKISVFMNVFNIHSNRSPVEGVVTKRVYYPGRFFNAAFDKASSENERNTIVIEAENGCRVTCVQIAGLLARRIICYPKEGDRLSRGQRYGFIRFGSRVDLYLPPTILPKVAIGDRVSAGETVVADF